MRKIPLCLASIVVWGCANHPVDPDIGAGASEEVWDNVAPTLRVVSPGQFAVGDDILFAGEGFISPDHGQAKIRFQGSFTEDWGDSYDVNFTVVPTWIGTGQLSWRFGPNVVFAPTGESIGRFSGQVIAINEPNDIENFDTLESSGMDLELEVTPSILLRTLRPENSDCANVVDGTIEGAPLELAADVIGLSPGKPYAPLRVTYQFVAPQFVVGFLGDEIGGHPVDRDPTPEDLLGQQGATAFDQIIDDGSTRLTLAARWQTRVEVAGETRYVAMFRAGALPQPQNEQEVLFNLRAEDSSGQVAHRAVHMFVRRISWLSYDGNQMLAERYQPMRVSACIPGAAPTTEAQYSESTGETRSRSLSFNWNMSTADSIGGAIALGLPPWNPFFANLSVNANRSWSEGFGMDVAATVSTEMSQVQGISGQIYPGEYGAFYRQTERLTRVGIVSGANECGVVGELGNALLTDWAWAAELAKSTSCPPNTHLPAAEVFK